MLAPFLLFSLKKSSERSLKVLCYVSEARYMANEQNPRCLTLCHPRSLVLDEEEVGCDNSLVPCQPCNRWVTQGCKPGPPLQQFGLSGALVFLDRVARLFSIRFQTSTGPCTKLYSGDVTMLLWGTTKWPNIERLSVTALESVICNGWVTHTKSCKDMQKAADHRC